MAVFLFLYFILLPCHLTHRNCWMLIGETSRCTVFFVLQFFPEPPISINRKEEDEEVANNIICESITIIITIHSFSVALFIIIMQSVPTISASEWKREKFQYWLVPDSVAAFVVLLFCWRRWVSSSITSLFCQLFCTSQPFYLKLKLSVCLPQQQQQQQQRLSVAHQRPISILHPTLVSLCFSLLSSWSVSLQLRSGETKCCLAEVSET